MMKKLTSFGIAAIMMMSGVNVHAYGPSLDFLNKTYSDSGMSNFETEAKINFKLDKDIKITDTLAKMADETELGRFIDTKGLIEGLFDSTIELNSKIEAKPSEKNIKMEASAKSSAPIRINRNLELNVNSSFDMWADMGIENDVTYMDYIMAMPYSSKYIILDDDEMSKLAEESQSDMTPGDSVKLIFDDEKLKEINEKNIASIQKNAKISGSNTNVNIVFSDTGLKKYIADLANTASEFYDDETKASIEESGILDEIGNVLKNVKLFDDDALTLNYRISSDGFIEKTDYTLKVNFNLADVLKAADSEVPGITKENSDIAFTVTGSTKVKYGTARVEKPNLTEDNSMTLSEFAGIEENKGIPDAVYNGYQLKEDYDYQDIFYADFDGNINMNENGIMVPLRALLEGCGYEVSYDNGKIIAEADDDDMLYTNFDKLEITIGSGKAYADGEEMEIGTAPAVIGDRAYVTEAAAEKLTDSIFDGYSYDRSEDAGWLRFRKNK